MHWDIAGMNAHNVVFFPQNYILLLNLFSICLSSLSSWISCVVYAFWHLSIASIKQSNLFVTCNYITGFNRYGLTCLVRRENENVWQSVWFRFSSGERFIDDVVIYSHADSRVNKSTTQTENRFELQRHLKSTQRSSSSTTYCAC